MDLLDQMRTFVRVVDAGSLSAAARSRRLSLPAVSRQLRALEADVGTKLILRTTRRLQITPSGQRWYAHCARILRDLDDARADVAESGDVRGAVVISAPITLGLALVVPKLHALVRENTKLEIDLRLEDHVVDLVGEGVDIAVRGGVPPPDSTSIVAHPMKPFTRVVVAAASYLSRRGTPHHPRELERHDCLVQGGLAAPFGQWRFESGGETIEVMPKARLRSTAPIVLRDWAVAGAGIAMLPDWLVPRNSRRLRRLLADWTTAPIRWSALHRVELRGAPRIRAVIAALARD